MYWRLLLMSFLAVSIQGITEEALQLAKCMIQCSHKSCWDKCDRYSNASEGSTSLPNILTNITNANVRLHCKDTNFLMIRHNPGTYVIEQGTKEDTWSRAKVTKGRFSSFSNLTAGTFYRYQLYRVTKKGVFQPELSPWFSTNEATYEPEEVKDISLERVDVEERDACKLYAEISYKPANDRSCYYDILWWTEYDVRSFQLERPRQFRYTKHYLEFDLNNTIWISSRNEKGSKTSNKTLFTFMTPTCLEMHNNLSICAPREVDGLLVKSDHIHEGLHDITITWNEPELKPDNYVIQLLSLRQSEDFIPIHLTVSGNETEAFFPSVDVGSQYQVSIIAESAGGTSPDISIYRYIDESQVTTSDSRFIKIIVVLSAMTMIAVSIGFAYACCKRGKRMRHKKHCKYLEGLDRKDAVFQMPKDDNQKTDYLIENDDPFARMDEFEIRPDRLQIKEILGRGAFGIVRLGSMRTECGEITDVAIKMPRDDPCADDIKTFQQEIMMMKSAGQHPNIVSLIGCCTLEKNKPLLVVEYCHRGDLQTYLRTILEDMMNAVNEQRTRFKIITGSSTETDLKKNELHEIWTSDSDTKVSVIANRLYDIEQDILHIKEKVTATDLLSFSRQIAKGMEFLSLNRIVHRDLAARNVLVCSDRTMKISDFGLSRDVYQENVYKKQGNGRLPIKWMAIESLTHQMYTTQSDVWSFGILLWEIVTLGSNPYPGTSANKVLKLLKSGYRMERPQNCEMELYNMMLACWRSRPQSRPTFTELKQNLDKLLSTVTENQYLNLSNLLQDSVINNRLRSEQKNVKSRNRGNKKHLMQNRYINDGQNLQGYKISLTNVT